eukprot:533245-Prymnesium_polylepis.1
MATDTNRLQDVAGARSPCRQSALRLAGQYFGLLFCFDDAPSVASSCTNDESSGSESRLARQACQFPHCRARPARTC